MSASAADRNDTSESTTTAVSGPTAAGEPVEVDPLDPVGGDQPRRPTAARAAPSTT